MSAINAIAAATFTPDASAIEAARAIIVPAVKTNEAASGSLVEASSAILTVWEFERLIDKAARKIIAGWIVEGLSDDEQAILALDTDKVTDKAARKAAQDKVSGYTTRMITYAFRKERAEAEKAAAERAAREAEANRSPEEKAAAEAKAEAAEASKASVQASYEVGKASADVKVVKAEAKALSEKVKAVKAAAKLDPSKAAEAAEAEAAAKAKAEEAKAAEAKLAEAAAKANDAKAIEEAKRKEALEKAEAIRIAKAVEATVASLRDLIVKARESCKGAEGLDDLTMMLRSAVDMFEKVNG